MIRTFRMRMCMLPGVVLLLVLLAGCGTPKAADLLGADAALLAQARIDGGLVMLGELPNGTWVMAVAKGDERSRHTFRPDPVHPMAAALGGVVVIAGQAPQGATKLEVITETRSLLKGRVEGGRYLIAWPSAVREPAFVLRLLDPNGTELYRWPPPGALPAA